MDFALLPPEINSGRMYTGPGAGPMLAAAAAWDALAAELESAAAGYSSVVSGLTGQDWSGPASAAMASAAAPYVEWLQASSAQAERAAMQAKTAAAAYEVAFAATVPPPVIAANRGLLATLVATNFLGQNTPAIAATEAHYAEMWAQDAAAMYGYAGASSSASPLTPFSEPPPTTNPAGLGTQAGAVAHAAAAGAHTQALSQLTTALPAAVHQLVSPLGSSSTSTTQASGLSQLSATLGSVEQSTGWASNTFSLLMPAYSNSTNFAAWAREVLVRGGIAGFLTFQGLGSHGGLSGVGGPFAGLGKAASLGALSVPPSWATAAAEIEPVAISLAAASTSTAPAAAAVGLPPGTAFQEALLGTMAGRGATTSADEDDRDEKTKKEKDGTQGERPAAALLTSSGWLASTWAYHTRRRADPNSQPLPSHWRQTSSAGQSRWG
jgi:PPE-repeat protein